MTALPNEVNLSGNFSAFITAAQSSILAIEEPAQARPHVSARVSL